MDLSPTSKLGYLSFKKHINQIARSDFVINAAFS